MHSVLPVLLIEFFSEAKERHNSLQSAQRTAETQ